MSVFHPVNLKIHFREIQNKTNFYRQLLFFFYEVILNRSWLCYFVTLDVTYSDSCWLRSKISNNWRTGIRDLKHLTLQIDARFMAKKLCPWQEKQQKQIRFQKTFWKMVLQTLLKITLLLGKCSLPFLAHRTSQEDFNGILLSQVKFLSDFDIMEQVIDMPYGSVRYLRSFIWNELIDYLEKQLTSELTIKISSASFLSLHLDTNTGYN